MKEKISRSPLLLSLVIFTGAMPIMWLFLTPSVRLEPFYCGETVTYLGPLLVVLGFCQDRFGKMPFVLKKEGTGKGLFTYGAAGLLFAGAALGFGWRPPEQFPGLPVLGGFLCCCGACALSEEILFRGLILPMLQEKYSLWKAVFLGSGLF